MFSGTLDVLGMLELDFKGFSVKNTNSAGLG